jgi:hypothetical protein
MVSSLWYSSQDILLACRPGEKGRNRFSTDTGVGEGQRLEQCQDISARILTNKFSGTVCTYKAMLLSSQSNNIDYLNKIKKLNPQRSGEL